MADFRTMLFVMLLTGCAATQSAETCETVCFVMRSGTVDAPSWARACLTVRDEAVYSELWWQNVLEVYETRSCDQGETYEQITWIGEV